MRSWYGRYGEKCYDLVFWSGCMIKNQRKKKRVPTERLTRLIISNSEIFEGSEFEFPVCIFLKFSI